MSFVTATYFKHPLRLSRSIRSKSTKGYCSSSTSYTACNRRWSTSPCAISHSPTTTPILLSFLCSINRTYLSCVACASWTRTLSPWPSSSLSLSLHASSSSLSFFRSSTTQMIQTGPETCYSESRSLTAVWVHSCPRNTAGRARRASGSQVYTSSTRAGAR
ncbi:hypothetical protein PENSPDRAFT_320427 [Peniophora sp. CONT]|nr:hypothetical protein PENSPDRAFT_320427 [Peniophora sp. CONT]